jgi:flagellin
MGLRFHTNVPGLLAQKALVASKSGLDRSVEKLTSGLKINHSGDDPAGLALSENLNFQIRGGNQAEKNAMDGLSVIQTAEGSLEELTQILVRMRELGVQSSSDTIGQAERKFINIEFQTLLNEFDRIACSTEFNGNSILNSSGKPFYIQVGDRSNLSTDRIQINETANSDINSSSLGLISVNVANKSSAQKSLTAIGSAISSITSTRAHFGAIRNRLQGIIKNYMLNREDLSSAMSHIRDTDMAEAVSSMTKNNILMQAGVSVLSQANSKNRDALTLLSQGGS